MDDETERSDPVPTEADVDQILAEFDGDHRAVIKALLHDVASLAADYRLSVSRGYTRGTSTLRASTG